MMAWYEYAEVEPTPCCGLSFISNVWKPEAVPPKGSTEKGRNSFLLITGGRNYEAEDEVYAETNSPSIPVMHEQKGTLTKLRKEGWIPLKKFRSRTTKRILTLWFKR